MTGGPRKFVSLSIAYVVFNDTGRERDVAEVLAAVADDGTAWIRSAPRNGKIDLEWRQVHALPDRVNEA